MIWDPTSHTYTEGPAEGGDLAVDRGHASGGDNDLFDPAAGNDGDGDGNLFQPSNPDNNGWLDGKTASPGWKDLFQMGEDDEGPYLSMWGLGMNDRVRSVHDEMEGTVTAVDVDGLTITWDDGQDDFFDSDPTGVGVIKADWDTRPGNSDHWGKFSMAMRPEQWQEIIGQNPYVYHVTEANRLPSVQQHGLAPGSTISEKTEGVWTEMGGIPARQGFIYLWATAEGAEHGAEWFLGIPNPIILTIDATKLDPNLIEADEDLLAADPQGFVDQHGGPTPEEYYGNTDEYDQGNWSGYDPMQIAEEPGSAWSMDHPKLGDPDVTYESYQGFGDRGDHHGRIAYGGSIPPDAILGVNTLDDFHTSRTADTAVMEPPTIAPAMPDINYVLDHNPEDQTEQGWKASVWGPIHDLVWKTNPPDIRQKLEDGSFSAAPIPWQQAHEWLQAHTNRQLVPDVAAAVAQATPDQEFVYRYNHPGDSVLGVQEPYSEWRIEAMNGTVSKIAMPYHVSPRGNRQEIERDGLQDTTGAGGIYHWDTPEQAKAYWDWLEGDNLDMFGQGFGPADVWGFDLTDEQQDRTEPDSHLHHDMWNYFRPDQGGDGERAFKEFHSEPWDPTDPETEEFGAWFTPGLEHVPPDQLKRVAMPYWHQSPRENRESIEEKGLLPGRDGNVYLTSDGDFGDTGDVFDTYLVDPSEKLGLDPTGDAESYGWDGKWWAHPGPVSPDRLKRVSMSEQTGEPTLDEFIQEFAQMVDAEQLRDPRKSWGQCIYHSEEFAAFLKKRGVDAKVIVLPRDEEWGKTQTLLRDPNYSDEEWAQTGITWNEAPQGATLNNLGYQGGDFEDHHAVQVDMNGRTYIVDWTATQYEGQNEVPQIFRADDSNWQREF